MLLKLPENLLSSSKFYLLVAGLLSFSSVFSQMGIGTAVPDRLSILDVRSVNKGVLIPRLSAAQQATLALTLTVTQAGMLVTDAATGKLMDWDGSAWTDLTTIAAKAPLNVSSTNQVSINPGTAVGDLITWDGNNWINMQPAVQHFSIAADNRQPYLALNYCICMQGNFPARNDALSPLLSQICVFPFNFTPRGWAACNGQLLPISQNLALFSLIGIQYGGNGTSTFALPNLQGRIPVNSGQGNGLTGYTIGDNGGVESNTISR